MIHIMNLVFLQDAPQSDFWHCGPYLLSRINTGWLLEDEDGRFEGYGETPEKAWHDLQAEYRAWAQTHIDLTVD